MEFDISYTNKFAMIGYNLMSLFRTFLLQEKTQKTLSTLRYRTFAVGAYFTKVNDKLMLKIANSNSTTSLLHRHIFVAWLRP